MKRCKWNSYTKILKTQLSEESINKRVSSSKKKKVQVKSTESLIKSDAGPEEGGSPLGSIKGSDIGSPQLRRSRTKLRQGSFRKSGTKKHIQVIDQGDIENNMNADQLKIEMFQT